MLRSWLRRLRKEIRSYTRKLADDRIRAKLLVSMAMKVSFRFMISCANSYGLPQSTRLYDFGQAEQSGTDVQVLVLCCVKVHFKAYFSILKSEVDHSSPLRKSGRFSDSENRSAFHELEEFVA